MENINKQFIDIKYKMQRREKLELHKKDLEERIETEKRSLDRLQNELQKEEEDVKRLEKISINSLISKISGNKELQLEKEKGDVIRAAVDYKQVLSDIEFKEYELKMLIKQLREYGDLEEELQSIIELKRKMMPKELREHIKKMETERLDLQLENKEIKEAKVTGERLLSSLMSLLESLNNYLDETSDPFFSYPEHEDFDEVLKECSVLKERWEIFQKELNDTNVDSSHEMNIQLVYSFSEYIFTEDEDNDVMLEKTKKTYAELNDFYVKMKKTLSKLDQSYQDNLFRISDLGFAIQEAIEAN